MEINDIENHIDEMTKLFGDNIKYLAIHYPGQFAYYWNVYQFYKNRGSRMELMASEQ